MKLLKIIGAGVLAGYCYKKVKAKRKDTKQSNIEENTEEAVDSSEQLTN